MELNLKLGWDFIITTVSPDLCLGLDYTNVTCFCSGFLGLIIIFSSFLSLIFRLFLLRISVAKRAKNHNISEHKITEVYLHEQDSFLAYVLILTITQEGSNFCLLFQSQLFFSIRSLVTGSECLKVKILCRITNTSLAKFLRTYIKLNTGIK